MSLIFPPPVNYEQRRADKNHSVYPVQKKSRRSLRNHPQKVAEKIATCSTSLKLLKFLRIFEITLKIL